MKTKRTILASCFIFFHSINLFAQPAVNSLLPQVDKRVELLSIVGKLANITGFHDSVNTAYAKEINKHFSSYKNHPLIKHLRELKPKLETTNWEIPAVAVHLSQPPKLEPLMAFTDTANIDDWESRELFNARFVTLLQQFYRDAKVESFFKRQEPYYKSVNQQYEKQGVKLNKEWVNKFFGLKTNEDYFAIVALGIRDGAYMRVNFQDNYRHTITIFECTSFDSRGIPTVFKNPMFPRMMLHEYIHAFTNQLIDKNSSELRGYAEMILKDPKVFKAMENTFYNNWQYLLYESLVRACAIKYAMVNQGIAPDVEKEIAAQEKAGFLWIRGLIKELGIYEANREKYKNIAEYMPQLNLFFRRIAEELSKQ